MDPYKKLRISLNPDGSLTRYSDVPVVPPFADDVDDQHSLSKDAPLNAAKGTSLRIFLPKSLDKDYKLPVVLYFHGGGFVLYSSSTSFFHTSSSKLSSELPAVVISVDYRLAPEHRLPAAYDDAADALFWVRDQARNTSTADPWLRSHADFSRVFLMGSSSGGNVAYQLGLRAMRQLGDNGDNIAPLTIQGLILNQPFFGGEERTESEVRMKDDRIVPLAVSDLLWELSLPEGESREHEYSNPKEAKGLPRCLIRGYVGDPLVDRQRMFAKMAEEEGVEVVARLEEEGFHGIEIFDEEKAAKLVEDVRRFVYRDGPDHGGETSGDTASGATTIHKL